jgi:hypothetical protein
MPNISNAVVNLIIASPPLLRHARHPLELQDQAQGNKQPR